jgi:hypothetical protein
VTDEDLRDLERRFRADPRDRDVADRLARALVRAGRACEPLHHAALAVPDIFGPGSSSLVCYICGMLDMTGLDFAAILREMERFDAPDARWSSAGPPPLRPFPAPTRASRARERTRVNVRRPPPRRI